MAPRAQASGEPSVRQEETVALPLDYYKLLGVSPVCSRDNLAKALEKCRPPPPRQLPPFGCLWASPLCLPAQALPSFGCSTCLALNAGPHPLLPCCRALLSPPSVGYSQQCLLGRGSALKRAVETLLDTQVGAGLGNCRANSGVLRSIARILSCAPAAALSDSISMPANIASLSHTACACPAIYLLNLLLAPALARRCPCPCLQSRKAYDDALRMGAITENVPDEFVPGKQARGCIRCGLFFWLMVFGSTWV